MSGVVGVKRERGNDAGLCVAHVVVFVHIAGAVDIACVALRIARGAEPPVGGAGRFVGIHAESLCIVSAGYLTRVRIVNRACEAVGGVLHLVIA